MNALKLSAVSLLAFVLLACAWAPARAECGGGQCNVNVCASNSGAGMWCIGWTNPDGTRGCENHLCDEGGGGGRVPVKIAPAGPGEGGTAPRSPFTGLTMQQAAALCATMPGCVISFSDNVGLRPGPTWGRLKVMYR